MPASVILHETREKSAKQRHPWVFSKAVDKVKGRVGKGDTVDVFSHSGEWLGRGAYSPDSQIRVRFWTFNQNESIDHVFFLKRIADAKSLRESMQLNANGYRLVAGESDLLPGVTIDVFDNTLVLQLLSAGADKHRDKIVSAIQKLYPDCHIYERSDVAVRDKEGLEQVKGPITETPDVLPEINENGLKLIVDVEKGHKTGFYLDQRDNRHAVREIANDQSVLNCFSYTGTFACSALAGGAKHVTNLDVSEEALARSVENLTLNGFSSEQYEHNCIDVFQALRDFYKEKKTFDVVILDPPKFVDSKASLNRAARGYKDINLYGMHAVKNGGWLFTFSCSGLMPADLFQKIVADAALDAGKRAHIVKYLTQASDHPILTSYPQGHYLKGLLCRITDDS